LRVPCTIRSTLTPSKSASRTSMQTTSRSERSFVLSSAASRSTSEPGPESHRAVEPNSDKCAAPASRSSFSCARSVVSTCSLFIIDSCPARASGQGWLTPESLGQSKGYSAPSISFHKNVTESILSERIEILPAVDDGSSVDFLNTLSYSGFKFSQGLDSDMPKEASRHLAKQGFDNV